MQFLNMCCCIEGHIWVNLIQTVTTEGYIVLTSMPTLIVHVYSSNFFEVRYFNVKLLQRVS